ncbi:unnamed protein product [Clonostachys rosea]|uniref:HNH nuclease domain-containing protein n=1 Tax=Bionectria ochroleuca TaxID=29856 RepID=A0ABY6UIM5_BIOOC|nr:unnamed protein product [Clonostachys rosea]
MDSPLSDQSWEDISSEYHAFTQFLKTATDADIDASISFHEAQIEKCEKSEEDHLPISEIVERIRLAERAQDILDDAKGINPDATCPSLELNLMQLSYFMYADKKSLESLIVDNPPILLEYRLRSIEPFLSLILQKSKGPVDFYLPSNMQASESTSLHQPCIKAVDGNRTISRNLLEADKARRRDEKCIATSCPEFQVCHILPFSINNATSKLRNARGIFQRMIIPIVPRKDWLAMLALLVPDSKELGTSDKEWNMLSLNPLAHAIWNKAYFALEWIGVDPDTEPDTESDTDSYVNAKLRWHWLANGIPEALGQTYLSEKGVTKGHSGRAVKLGTDHQVMATAIKQGLNSASKVSTNGVSLCRMSNFRPLMTDDVVRIKVKAEDVEKTKLMIELQWLALRMVAFCAAAEVVDELDSEPRYRLQDLSTWWDPSTFC